MPRRLLSVLMALAVVASAVACGGGSSKDKCKLVPGAPTGLVSTGRTATSVALSWTGPAAPASCSITGYAVFDGGVEVAVATSSSVEVQGLASNQVHTLTVAARDAAGTSEPSAAIQVTTLPDLGPNTHIYDPTMSMAAIQADIDAVYEPQYSADTGQFNSNRWALLFKPGQYTVDVPVGYYMQVLGLGALPDDVTITGRVHSEGHWSGAATGKYNATQNFWRGLENFAVIPTPNVGALPITGEEDDGGTYMRWAVSQASPFRRMHVKGDIDLWQGPKDGWSSGGWMSDSKIDGTVRPGSQQQWFSRNSEWTAWSGNSWNYVFMGDTNMPAGDWPSVRVTRIPSTPVIREKPFLHVDEAGDYFVYVPSLASGTTGATWTSDAQTPGTDVSILDFFVARPGDAVEDINAALASGKNLLFTPGIYHLDGTIEVTQAGAVVLGIGLATLHPDTGLPAMTVADVDGVVVAGLLFDAGVQNSPVLLQVGPENASADHSANPTVLQDLFFRIGGAEAGKADVAMVINSHGVVGDHFWIWRADHGAGVGWTENPSTNGLIVNGEAVTIYGLFCEHFEEYQTIWNGNGGRLYFYQSEDPYDVPNQSEWLSHGGTVNGYASYKVADSVTDHEAWGLGVYSVAISSNWDAGVTEIVQERAIEVPEDVAGVRLHNMMALSIIPGGVINHVINGVGARANGGPWSPTVGVPVVEWPVPPAPPAPPGLVFPLNFEASPNEAYQLPSWGNCSVSLVEDPGAPGNHVAHFAKPAGSETWAGFNMDRDTATSTGLASNPFLTSMKFTVRARCEQDDVTVLLKLEQWGGSPSVEVQASTGPGTAGTWQTLSYDFTGTNPVADVPYLRIDLFPGFNSSGPVSCDLDDVTHVVQ